MDIKKKKKLISLPKLKKKVWKLISIYVRSKDTEPNGFTNCFTCQGLFYWKDMDCGHYIHGKLDFCLDNLKPQCSRCNRWLHGNLGKYGERLVQKYGLAWIANLRLLSHTKGNYYTRQELNEITEKYK